jgi:hypothetical protein
LNFSYNISARLSIYGFAGVEKCRSSQTDEYRLRHFSKIPAKAKVLVGIEIAEINIDTSCKIKQ